MIDKHLPDKAPEDLLIVPDWKSDFAAICDREQQMRQRHLHFSRNGAAA